MKVWSAVFNLLGICIIVIMVTVFYRHLDVIQTDYDTAVLRQAVEYAGRASFRTALESGSADTDYTHLGVVRLNPSETLNTFTDIICMTYNLALSDENKEYIERHIPTAILCGYDGYYITELRDGDTTEYVNKYYKKGTTDVIETAVKEQSRLGWSLKMPYVTEVEDKIVALSMDGGRYLEVGDNGNLAEGITTEELANSRINAVISDALSNNIKQIRAGREAIGQSVYGRNYRVYIPAETTFSGINSIDSPTLIILLEGGDFAGKAKKTEASISGLKVIEKDWVVGYSVGGEDLYCYASQYDLEESLTATVYYTSAMEAARAGYNPDYERLVLPRK